MCSYVQLVKIPHGVQPWHAMVISAPCTARLLSAFSPPGAFLFSRPWIACPPCALTMSLQGATNSLCDHVRPHKLHIACMCTSQKASACTQLCPAPCGWARANESRILQCTDSCLTSKPCSTTRQHRTPPLSSNHVTSLMSHLPAPWPCCLFLFCLPPIQWHHYHLTDATLADHAGPAATAFPVDAPP